VEHAYVRRLRELIRLSDSSYATFRKGIENPEPAIAANVIIGLIRVTTTLLDRQLRSPCRLCGPSDPGLYARRNVSWNLRTALPLPQM
jgi:hypothetical protein